MSNTATMDEKNHAIENAKAWLDTICQMVAALAAFDEIENGERDEDEEVTIDGDVMASREHVIDRIQESPLSVLIRNGWYAPGGDNQGEPEEFEILLSTGGPALRIIGDLDEHNEPTRPRLQYQDWGTPWTEYIVAFDDPEHDQKRAALQTFCDQFYFDA